MSGFRVREPEMLALGMSLPGLRQRAGAIAALPSLGLLTLAGMTPANWTVSYHEAATVDDELIQAIAQEEPTLVGISALTASALEAYGLGDRLRALGIQTVLGGLHATATPEDAAPHFDAVVVGDGEPVWTQVLADAATGTLRGRYQAAAPFDLSTSPLPRLDLLGGRERPRYTLQTARGCPFACEFCGASRLLGPFREKPTAVIERELAAITTLDPRAVVELADDNTFAGRRSATELLSVLERSGIRYFTECDWRIGERPEVLDQLAASGCVQVLVGVESLVFRHPGMGAKDREMARIMDALARVQDAGVAVIGCFIVGAEGENHDSMQQLCEFILGCPLADVQLTLQTPFPGTGLHERLKREGRLLEGRSWESYTLFDVTYQPDRLSVQELESGFRNLVRMVYAAEPCSRRNAIRQQVWARRQGAMA
jgi:radical SAM superfamily enzyme YgiQ (UPF0313 family)